MTETVARADTLPFVAVRGQCFLTHGQWVEQASRVLTAHPKYHDTEHHGPAKGWRGPHFTALCFDQKGRRCRNGGDMRRADEEGAFPVWWVWPDQIAGLLMGTTEP
jgi:hypothetical protein